MASTDVALWHQRFLRFALGGSPPLVSAALGVLRNKWLALHLETAGLGVLAQVVSGQMWLGTATGLGLGLPVARAIGAAAAAGDEAATRRTLQTAFTLVAWCGLVTVTLGLMAAPLISQFLLGTSEHAGLVRISMLGMAGFAILGLLQGVFAGRSDVRAAFTAAAAGGATALAVTLVAVPRLGVAGGMWGAALLFPAGAMAALWAHGRRYPGTRAAIARPGLDPQVARSLVRVGGAALALALADQGALIALRSHYLREHGVPANGLLQAALSLSQQVGGLFLAYLANYAFGKISGTPGTAGIRDYTRRHWKPLMVTAALAFALALASSSQLLHLFFSRRFEAARSMMAWMMVGEFARVGVQVWALGALPLGGIRTWMPIGLWSTAALALAYVTILQTQAGSLSLPLAYAAGNLTTLAFTGVWMSRRGVTLSRGDGLVTVALLAGLMGVAWAVARG